LVHLAVTLVILTVSGIGPREPLTWFLEVLPILIALPILGASYKRFPLTPLVYACLVVHAGILALGGHYTYAEVPLGSWVQNALSLERNHYDRVGHFAQGFVPALVVREVLLRKTPLVRGGWLFFIVTSVCLAISAAYEFLEWFAAVVLGQGADAFLGTQGDPWDTQWDMFLAFVGAMLAQILLGTRHDRELERRATS
jgi:putative membrane protein